MFPINTGNPLRHSATKELFLHCQGYPKIPRLLRLVATQKREVSKVGKELNVIKR